MVHTVEFSLDRLPKNPRIAVVASIFHKEMVPSMMSACIATLEEYQVETLVIVETPGEYEIPLAVQRLADTNQYDCIIALGVIIQGDTMHFDLVAQECARGIMDAMLSTNTPVIFEVLATYDTQQALDRSSGTHNKGKEAALSALKILSTFHNHSLS